MSDEKKGKLGVFLAVFGGICWGFSGICGQFLFEQRGWTAKWLVSVRLLTSGLLMLIYVLSKQEGRRSAKSAFTTKSDLARLIFFSIFGIGMCQLTYFSAVEASNAGAATVIQYTAPIFIMLYGAFRARKMPTIVEFCALVMSIAGTFFLATHGSLESMAISKEALAWGLLSSLATLFYNLIPVKLMDKYGTVFTTGWGMFIAGIIMCMIIKPWHLVGTFDIAAIAAFAVIVSVGTIISFLSYLKGVQLIGATKASLCGSSEPVMAMILSVAIMGVPFAWMDFIGMVLIVGAVTALSLTSGKKVSNEVLETGDGEAIAK